MSVADTLRELRNTSFNAAPPPPQVAQNDPIQPKAGPSVASSVPWGLIVGIGVGALVMLVAVKLWTSYKTPKEDPVTAKLKAPLPAHEVVHQFMQNHMPVNPAAAAAQPGRPFIQPPAPVVEAGESGVIPQEEAADPEMTLL